MNLDRAHALHDRLRPELERLQRHPVYARQQTLDGVRVLMQHHVFAVWDFMSLVKAVQGRVTGGVPWRPVATPEVRRAISEIALEEEADHLPDGRVLSHYELYLDAMREVGADTRPVEAFVAQLGYGVPADRAARALALPRPVRRFVATTLRHANDPDLLVPAAAFTFGREQAVPSMFRGWLRALDEAHLDAPSLRLYLERHIGLDEQEHGPAALGLVAHACGDDEEAWWEAETIAREALAARRDLWDAAARAMPLVVPVATP